DPVVKDMLDFGHHIGVAFQMKDDLFDYGDNKTGKPTGNDIREKKITLPLIHTLTHTDPKTRRQIIRVLKKRKKSTERVNFVIAELLKGEDVHYPDKKMNERLQIARTILLNYPVIETRAALLPFIEFFGKRNFYTLRCKLSRFVNLHIGKRYF